MNPELAQLALQLLQRVQLTGNEVEAYVAVTNALRELAAAPQPEPKSD